MCIQTVSRPKNGLLSGAASGPKSASLEPATHPNPSSRNPQPLPPVKVSPNENISKNFSFYSLIFRPPLGLTQFMQLLAFHSSPIPLSYQHYLTAVHNVCLWERGGVSFLTPSSKRASFKLCVLSAKEDRVKLRLG